ncbi:hypothetical protein BsWGS_26248 [Bradybaena similaris]
MSSPPRSNSHRGPDLRIPQDERQKYGIMPPDGAADRVCPKSDTDSCPSGHMLHPCASGGGGYYCKQCSNTTFQPNENWINDKCRLRRSCSKLNMRYAYNGTAVRDAVCACMEGYHFPNEDQRACVPNKECPKGTAPGIYGTCELCLPKGMYSDTIGRIKECKPLTNCEKQNRCTVVKSNGETDNVCGETVKDLNTCEEMNPFAGSLSTTLTITIVTGAALLLVILLILFIFFLRRRRLHSLMDRQVLSEEAMEELQQKVVKESDRSPEFCKKVLATSGSFIEERIDRQIWALAQELFRSSSKQGHFEQIVNKYKDSQAKYTVNGYMQEWRVWKGESKDTVAELFHCLRHIKRDDIVREICMCLRHDVDYQTQCQEAHPSSKLTLKDECVYVFFPCVCHKREHPPLPVPDVVVVETEASEAGTKLLAIATDDLDFDEPVHTSSVTSQAPCTFCSSHPSPSAPDLEDISNGFPSMDNVKYNRHYSQPVQATS